MSSNRSRRIAKEVADIHADTWSQVEASIIGPGDDLSHLKGSFRGPDGTPYEGGRYVVDVRIPTDYPFRPPIMKFDTRIWHPNISSQTGAICLDTLASAWSPVLTIKSALLSLQSLLSTPEPRDPQDAEVAGMLLQNPSEFDRVARSWAARYAGAGKTHEVIDLDMSDSEDTQRNYGGYDKAMVDRFVLMGFALQRVVTAFREAGIEAKDHQLEDSAIGRVTSQLLGEG